MILNNKLLCIISVITGGAGQQLLMSAAAAQVSRPNQASHKILVRDCVNLKLDYKLPSLASVAGLLCTHV